MEGGETVGLLYAIITLLLVTSLGLLGAVAR